MPEEFLELRRQMEARLGKRGRRQYVQVQAITGNVLDDRSRLGSAAGAPFSGHLLRCDQASGVVRSRAAAARLDLENYPHLPMAEVALTRAADYQVLLQQAI